MKSLHSTASRNLPRETSCLVCGASIEPFMDFGAMPIANGFLTPDEFQDEFWYELKPGHCTECKMVQLVERIAPDRLFHNSYAFFSSTSQRMATHFETLAQDVLADRLPEDDSFVVEIGSNDGVLLRHFAAANVRHLGVEPSANVAQAAVDRGVDTRVDFFNPETALRIVDEHGQADVILAANVMCHMPDINTAMVAIRLLLKPDGVMIFEDPYLGDIIAQTAYDQIYDEHVFYFSISSVSNLLGNHGFEIVEASHQNVHGGSMRYTFAHQGAMSMREPITDITAREEGLGLGNAETFASFRGNVEQSRDELMSLLRDLNRAGKRVVGYGATSKSTTVTNYCGITPELVEFISDTTPGKQGKVSPGTHIPVKPYQAFLDRYPDYALLFAWNHAGEIMERETAFTSSGGKWIMYVPQVATMP